MGSMIPTKHPLDASTSARAASGPAGSPGGDGPAVAGPSETEAHDHLTDAEKLQVHLASAAEVATNSGVSLDEFMRMAWSAYVDSRPGLREHLADAQLVQQIMELRSQGKVGQA